MPRSVRTWHPDIGHTGRWSLFNCTLHHRCIKRLNNKNTVINLLTMKLVSLSLTMIMSAVMAGVATAQATPVGEACNKPGEYSCSKA